MVNKYGNYFIKLLLTSSNKELRLIILQSIEKMFVDACFDTFGIHPVQTLLSLNLSPEEELFVRDKLKGQLFKLSIVKSLI